MRADIPISHPRAVLCEDTWPDTTVHTRVVAIATTIQEASRIRQLLADAYGRLGMERRYILADDAVTLAILHRIAVQYPPEATADDH